MTFYAPGPESATPGSACLGCEPLQPLRDVPGPGLEAVVAEWLHDVYVVPDAASGAGRARAVARGRAARHARRPRLHAAQRELPRAGHRAARRAVAAARNRGARRSRIAAARDGADRPARRRRGPRRATSSGGAPALDALRERIDDEQQRQHALQLEALRLAEQERARHAARRADRAGARRNRRRRRPTTRRSASIRGAAIERLEAGTAPQRAASSSSRPTSTGARKRVLALPARGRCRQRASTPSRRHFTSSHVTN